MHFSSDTGEAILVNWGNDGAIRDTNVDPLPVLLPAESAWLRREPDLIIQILPQKFPQLVCSVTSLYLFKSDSIVINGSVHMSFRHR